MRTPEISAGLWYDAIETIHRFTLSSVVVKRQWVYKAGQEPRGMQGRRLEQVEHVWIYAILTVDGGLRKITACMAPMFAFEPSDKLLEHLEAHSEKWADSQPTEIPPRWFQPLPEAGPPEPRLEEPERGALPLLQRL